MRVEFLKAGAVDQALGRLIDGYDEFHWAVAWGSMTGAAKKLLSNSEKMKDVTFGIAFSHTDPALIERLIGKRAKVVATFAGGTFHPKVYGFRSGRKAASARTKPPSSRANAIQIQTRNPMGLHHRPR